MNYNLHYQETFYPRINIDSIDIHKQYAAAGNLLDDGALPQEKTFQLEMYYTQSGWVLYHWYRDPQAGLCAEILPLVNHPELYDLWNTQNRQFIPAEAEAFLAATAEARVIVEAEVLT